MVRLNASYTSVGPCCPRDTEGAAATLPPAATGQAGTRLAPTSFVDHISYRIFNWETDQVREELIRRKRLTATVQPDTGGGPGYSSFHVSDPDGFNLQISGWAGPKDFTKKK